MKISIKKTEQLSLEESSEQDVTPMPTAETGGKQLILVNVVSCLISSPGFISGNEVREPKPLL